MDLLFNFVPIEPCFPPSTKKEKVSSVRIRAPPPPQLRPWIRPFIIDTAFNTDCDNSACALQTVTSAAAIAADDTLHMYFGSSGRSALGKTRAWNAEQLLPEAIYQFMPCLKSFL